MSARVWSPAQQAVFEAVADESPEAARHLVVEALAGSGKTTTIVEAMCHVRESQSVLAVAFNKSIAEELKPRVPAGVEVSTLHSYGLRAVTQAMGRREIDGQWTAKLVAGIMGRDWGSKEARNAVCKLVSIGKATLQGDAAALDALADAYGIEFPKGWERSRLISTAQRVLADAAVASSGPIDFDDMIWLPIVRQLPLRAYDWVFVDETQDLNPCQLRLVVRAAGPRGRIVAVGDRRQAIYGFRGADREAIPRMIRELSARVLPLNVTYRCPGSVVAAARKLVPALEAAPNAAAGTVREANMQALERDARPGDFVISRTNAPLIGLCYRWLKAGRRATIKGRDVGAGLAAWVRGTRAPDVPMLMRCIDSWVTAEVKRLEAAERSCTEVLDKAECLEALCEGCSSIQAVLAKIDDLFSESMGSSDCILLTSTHRAKGLEADRVWLLRDTYKRWPGIEEDNLLYVAITRSKRELVYVSDTACEREQEAAA